MAPGPCSSNVVKQIQADCCYQAEIVFEGSLRIDLLILDEVILNKKG